MVILLIGATGFIGSWVTRELIRLGHEITVFHRGLTPAPAGAHEIIGDRNHLDVHSDVFRCLPPDVAVDFALSNEHQAKQLVNTLRGLTARIVAISSGDVYRACGILYGFEAGALQPMPLTEESELRTRQNVYSPEVLARLRRVFSWLGEEYDKIPVERVVISCAEPSGTVLRLPMVYGPGDPLHRLFPYLKRMDNKRRAILLQHDAAKWRGPRGYVENVAAAITLATLSNAAAGNVYNIAEQEPLSEGDWIRKISRAANWAGSVLSLSAEETPAHLRVSYRTEQHWIMSSARIRSELGFEEPVDFTLGLERTIAWERQNQLAEVDPNQFDYAAEDAVLTRVGWPIDHTAHSVPMTRKRQREL